jgi:polyisoprenoid-binding protein YceI
MKVLFAFLLLLFVPFAAQAEDKIPEWQIVPEQSSLSFSGTQQGAGFDGKFGEFSGTIQLDPDHPETGKAQIKIQMGSASTNSPDRDKYIVGDAWFAADKFPAATYDILSFEKQADGHFVAHGKLTLRDVTLPLDLPFTLKVETKDGVKTAHAEGTTSLHRLDYGVGQGEWKDTSMVGDSVSIKVSVTATEKKS